MDGWIKNPKRTASPATNFIPNKQLKVERGQESEPIQNGGAKDLPGGPVNDFLWQIVLNIILT